MTTRCDVFYMGVQVVQFARVSTVGFISARLTTQDEEAVYRTGLSVTVAHILYTRAEKLVPVTLLFSCRRSESYVGVVVESGSKALGNSTNLRIERRPHMLMYFFCTKQSSDVLRLLSRVIATRFTELEPKADTLRRRC